MNPKKEYDMLKSQIADSKASYLKHSSNHTPQVNVFVLQWDFPFFYILKKRYQLPEKNREPIQLCFIICYLIRMLVGRSET
jgi:hypothetical protein